MNRSEPRRLVSLDPVTTSVVSLIWLALIGFVLVVRTNGGWLTLVALALVAVRFTGQAPRPGGCVRHRERLLPNMPGLVIGVTVLVSIITATPNPPAVEVGLGLAGASTLASLGLRRALAATERPAWLLLGLGPLLASIIGTYSGIALFLGSTPGLVLALGAVGPSVLAWSWYGGPAARSPR